MHTEKGVCNICILLMILFMGFAQRPDSRKVLSVCDVLSNLDFYQGKTLAVNGVYNYSSHGWSLRAYYSNRPCQGLEGRKLSWPSGISLNVLPSDMPRIQGLLSDIQNIQNDEYDKHRKLILIKATFLGELKSKRDLKISPTREGSYQGNGYGSQGQYPAELTIKDIGDIHTVEEIR